MKVFKRLVAALLRATCSMPSQAARAIKGEFDKWAKPRTVTWYGKRVGVPDCATCYIKVKSGLKSTDNVTQFEYMVYTLDGKKQLRRGYSKVYLAKDNSPEALVEGGRRTVLTAVKIRAKINDTWSAWTGFIGIIPIHTPDYVKQSYNSKSNSVTITWSKFTGMKDYEIWVSTSGYDGWKMMARTTGNSYTLKSFNGAPLKKDGFQSYYYKVIGRANVSGTVTKAKGDSNEWHVGGFMIMPKGLFDYEITPVM